MAAIMMQEAGTTMAITRTTDIDSTCWTGTVTFSVHELIERGERSKTSSRTTIFACIVDAAYASALV